MNKNITLAFLNALYLLVSLCSPGLALCEGIVQDRTKELRTKFLPKRIGDCIDLKIMSKHGRLQTSFDDTAIIELGGGFRVYVSEASKIDRTFPARKKYSERFPKELSEEYSNAVGNYIMLSSDFAEGDNVKACLKTLPKNCPLGDDRGKVYSVTSHRNPTLAIEGADSWHRCGGA